MNKICKILSEKNGSAGVGTIIVFVIFIMIILPLMSFAMEHYRVDIVRHDTSVAVELSLISTLTTLDIGEASAENYDFDSTEFSDVFISYLATNMKLNKDLSITDKSLVDGDVVINNISYFGTANLPYTNPNTSEVFTRPYFNVELQLEMHPSMFRQMFLELTGRNRFFYTFYDDVSMPVNN